MHQECQVKLEKRARGGTRKTETRLGYHHQEYDMTQQKGNPKQARYCGIGSEKSRQIRGKKKGMHQVERFSKHVGQHGCNLSKFLKGIARGVKSFGSRELVSLTINKRRRP